MYIIIFKKMSSAKPQYPATPTFGNTLNTTVCLVCCDGLCRTGTTIHKNPPKSITVYSCAELLKKLPTLSDEYRKIALANHNRLADLKCLGMAFENLDNPHCQKVTQAQLESSIGHKL